MYSSIGEISSLLQSNETDTMYPYIFTCSSNVNPGVKTLETFCDTAEYDPLSNIKKTVSISDTEKLREAILLLKITNFLPSNLALATSIFTYSSASLLLVSSLLTITTVY